MEKFASTRRNHPDVATRPSRIFTGAVFPGAVLEEPRNLPARCFRAHPPSPMSPRVRPPAGPSPTWPTSTHPSRWFFPSYQQTPRRPALAPGMDRNAAQQWPSIWAALLHRTVVRSGLQRHRKVSRLRMVVELPATATPPHGASASATLLLNQLAATAPSVYLHTTDQEPAQSLQSCD